MSTAAILFALALWIGAAILAWVVNGASRLRRDDRDTGDLWARVLKGWGGAVAVVWLVSVAIQPPEASPAQAPAAPSSWERFWQSGIHPQIDRISDSAYPFALSIPVVLWAIVLLWLAAKRPSPPAEARWVAGGIGFSPSRRWLLLAAAPIAAVLLASMPSLRGGEDAYPSALWSSMATIVVTLAALAAGSGSPPRAPAAEKQRGEAQAQPALAPWPVALREQGVRVEPILTFEPDSALSGPVGAGAARPLDAHVREVKDCLLQSAGASAERSCLLLAPDDMGQIELLAELADTLLEQAREATLVVISTDPDSLLAPLQRQISAGTRADVMRPGRVLGGADLWIVDADTLSDSFLPRLGGEPSLGRIGLVVWWDAHAYTGVLAANMWAVSRRLDRLIRAAGREDIRTLVFVRSTPDPGAQLGRYIRRIFPYELREIPAGSVSARGVELHWIASCAGFFDGRRDAGVPLAVRHSGLIAALASMRAAYTTHLDSAPGITHAEQDAFARLDISGEPAGSRLAPSPPAALASIRHVRSGDALALPEMIRATGRAAPFSGPAQVGVVPPTNPYARYVLSSRFPSAARAASRRLVCAESRPRIVERHLLLALSEMEDTRENLRATALWNEDVVRRTLDRLDRENKLRSVETRSLGKDGRLRIDRVYKSLKSLPEHVRPLDTASAELILVRDVSSKDGGVRRMVDRERLPVVAYPQCAFMAGGVRYEVRDWDSLDGAVERGWVECQVQDKHRITWRRRDVRIAEVNPVKDPVRAFRSAHALARQIAAVVYEETVRGAHMLVFNAGAWQEHKSTLQRPIRTRFATQALLLELAPPADHAALASVAQALRHVLPVHLGVEEDAIEVVPLSDGPRPRVAVVDLFPDGIGVVPAIAEDDDFLLTVLGRAYDWLEACTCRDSVGCAECLRTLEASAANPDNVHRRAAALGVLSRMVARGAPQRS